MQPPSAYSFIYQKFYRADRVWLKTLWEVASTSCCISLHEHVLLHEHVPFCSSAVLDPRVGHTMNVLSPFDSILCHSDWLFHRESCSCLDVVYPWSSSPACTWHCFFAHEHV